jgi:hypothetical protein
MHYPVQTVYDQCFEDDQRLHELVARADSLLVFGNHLLHHLNNFITSVAPLRAPAVTYFVPCNVCGFHPVTTAAIEAPSAPTILTWVDTHAASPAAALGPTYGHGALMANAPIAQPQLLQASERKVRRKQLPSIPSAAMDPLPRGPKGWRVAVSQWDEKLKDWKEYRGEIRRVSAKKLKTREIIAKEYNAYVPFASPSITLSMLTRFCD